MSKKEAKKGSLLVMVILALTVASVFLGGVLFDIRGTIDQERLYKTRKHMGYLEVAIKDFRLNNPSYNLASAGIGVLVTRPTGVSPPSIAACGVTYVDSYKSMQVPTGWCGPYLDKSLFIGDTNAYMQDAWGTNFVLSATANGATFIYVITSYGEDGVSGGGDDIVSSSF